MAILQSWPETHSTPLQRRAQRLQGCKMKFELYCHLTLFILMSGYPHLTWFVETNDGSIYYTWNLIWLCNNEHKFNEMTREKTQPNRSRRTACLSIEPRYTMLCLREWKNERDLLHVHTNIHSGSENSVHRMKNAVSTEIYCLVISTALYANFDKLNQIAFNTTS